MLLLGLVEARGAAPLRPPSISKRSENLTRASASASPRYASERDSQSRHCQSTAVACRTSRRGGSGWCGRIGGVSGGLSPPEHLLRATAPGGSARWRDSTAIVVERFQFEDNFCRVRSDPVPDLRITLCSALCTVVCGLWRVYRLAPPAHARDSQTQLHGQRPTRRRSLTRLASAHSTIVLHTLNQSSDTLGPRGLTHEQYTFNRRIDRTPHAPQCASAAHSRRTA